MYIHSVHLIKFKNMISWSGFLLRNRIVIEQSSYDNGVSVNDNAKMRTCADA